MKIIREGKEYELTAIELQQAYTEQEMYYHMQDIEDGMEENLDNDEYKVLKDNKDFIRAAAELLKKYRGDDWEFREAVKQAIEEIKDYYYEEDEDYEDEDYEE